MTLRIAWEGVVKLTLTISQASLSFNPQRSKLVVIDGQHRAMAMLAIRRTKAGNWGDRGRDYKHFYEDLSEELHDAPELHRVQMPVCLCFFPDLTETFGKGQTPVQVCRKLFLDVNKTARRPTRARTLLLDDSNVLAVFCRGVLTEARRLSGKRKDAYRLSIEAFEYDSPKSAPVPRRELALCSVEMLYELIYWSLFADDAFYELQKRPGGRRHNPQRERLLREIRADETIATDEYETWGYCNLETELDPEEVPIAAQATLTGAFVESWGKAIIRFFECLHPFNAHIKAMADLRSAHESDSGHGSLAYKALFEGQGILWTVESHARHRREERAKGIELPRAQIEKAYDAVENWLAQEFQMQRARYLWGLPESKPVPEEKLKAVQSSFKIFRTQAFQVGVMMAFAYLKEKLKLYQPEEFMSAYKSWIEAWNAVFFPASDTRREKALRTFDRNADSPASLMFSYPGGLKPSHWFWFRYFTFEMMAASGSDFPGRDLAVAAANKQRRQYLLLLRDQYQKSQRLTGKTIPPNEALANVSVTLREALKTSLGFSKSEFDSWFRGVRHEPEDAVVMDEDTEEENS